MAARRQDRLRSRFYALRLAGFDERSAGNLTALQFGLLPVHDGWTLEEIERLLFLRFLVRTRPSSRS